VPFSFPVFIHKEFVMTVMTKWLDRCKGAALASLAFATLAGASAAQAQALEKELVIATTGGLMEKTLVQHFYTPFSKAKGVEVVPAAIEVPDQWAKVQAMSRGGGMEFDIVTATPPDLVQKKDLLQPIDCAKLPSVAANGVKGACTPYGVIRTVGGMQIGYSTEAFKGANVPRTWADFWDVAKFPARAACPTPATASGGCPWRRCWPTASRPTSSFRSTSTAPTGSSTRSAPTSPCGGRAATSCSRSCATRKWS
jgi:spermidine/putrescine-binding protein